jgi:DNA-binding NarL/FixJ family response regulator
VTIRVLIVEDHALVRAGIEQLLAGIEDIEVVGTAGTGGDGVKLASQVHPDVVLMDLLMPEMDGREATGRILAARPETNIVVLTSFSDREQIIEALDTGAVGYLIKDAEPDELIRGIRSAARGESPLAPKAARALIRSRQHTGAAQLSDREREVLTLIARGYANKRIALELGIAERTVKAHATRIFERVGVSDRTQAAVWAQRHGVR